MKVALSFGFALIAAFANPVFAADNSRTECVRINQVRAFAVQDDNSIVIRQGKDTFRSIQLAEGCPVAQADRIGFVLGSQQMYTVGTGARSIPVSSTSIVNRFCSATPHAYLSVIKNNEDRRTRCKVVNIEAATREQFEQTDGAKDNRY